MSLQDHDARGLMGLHVAPSEPYFYQTEWGYRITQAFYSKQQNVLKQLLEEEAFTAVIPAWGRLSHDWNIQHHAHHHPLDEHTIRVILGTHQSPYLDQLSQSMQCVAMWSAMLHDIDKRTGPKRLHGSIPNDRLHPLRSARLAVNILSSLGCDVPTIQRVYKLVHHHQSFGRLFVRYPKAEEFAPQSLLEWIAVKLGSPEMVTALAAISEGDIRSVQKENGLFTQAVEEKLGVYHQQVGHLLTGWSKHRWLPEQNYAQSTRAQMASFYTIVPSVEAVNKFVQQLVVQGGCYWIPYTPVLAERIEQANGQGQWLMGLGCLSEQLAGMGTGKTLQSNQGMRVYPATMAQYYHLFSHGAVCKDLPQSTVVEGPIAYSGVESDALEHSVMPYGLGTNVFVWGLFPPVHVDASALELLSPSLKALIQGEPAL